MPARWGSGKELGPESQPSSWGGGRSWVEEEEMVEEEEVVEEDGRGEPVLLLSAESPCGLNSHVRSELEIPERQGTVSKHNTDTVECWVNIA